MTWRQEVFVPCMRHERPLGRFNQHCNECLMVAIGLLCDLLEQYLPIDDVQEEE